MASNRVSAAARPGIGGRLAKTGAQGLRFGKTALNAYTAPPDHLGPVARDEWALIVTEMAEMRILSRADAPLIEMAARAFERWQGHDRYLAELDAKRAQGDLPAELGHNGFLSGPAQARAAAQKEYRSLRAELGLTPLTRQRAQDGVQPTFMDQLVGSSPAGAGGDPVDAAGVDPFGKRPAVVPFPRSA